MKSELNFAKPISREQLLRDLAARYIWWKTPDEALLYPQRIAAQVMNLGDFDDARIMAEELGDEFLRHVLVTADIGQFNPRSWHYWHYRLDMAELGGVPAMPSRRLP